MRMIKTKQRDAPTVGNNTGQASWLCSLDAYQALCANGYTRLSDCAEVKMCASVYANLISSMTLHLLQNTLNGDIRVKNALSRKLDIEPHKLMTRKSWVYNIVWTMLTTGDGNQVTYPHYEESGMLGDLEPLKPSQLSFLDKTEERGYYIVYGGNRLEPDEVLHFIINPDPERPWIGTGYRATLKDILKGIKQANHTKLKLMESPAPSIIVKVDGLTEEFSNVKGRRKLREQYIDASENGEPWIIPSENFSVDVIKPLTLNDLAIERNIELDKRTIAGLFGVPAFLVGVGEFNADEFNHFISTRLMPMATNIEQELTRKLIYSPDMYWHFNPRSLFAYSLTEIITAGSAMVDRMAMRRNEWRDWIGLTPDEEMEELLALENYIPADKLGEQNKLKGGEETGKK